MKSRAALTRTITCSATGMAFVIAMTGGMATSLSADPPAIERLKVTPSHLELTGKRAVSQVLVTGFAENGETIDLTRAAEFADCKLVNNDHGYFQARQDGAATIEVRAGGQTTTLDLTVTEAATPQPISFRWETLAVLTKQGCNSGSCHGKPNGRGALELSLNAFDPLLDARHLVRGSMARFTEPLAPDQSLMLKKPTLRVPHGGGKRLRTDDDVYAILKQWIYEGCHIDTATAAECVEVAIEPPARVIRLSNQAAKQQMRVVARFSDGSARDVTRIATYTLSNAVVASVDANGLVTGQQRGQTAVVVRYLDDIVSAYLTFVRDDPDFSWPDPPENNYVDRLVHAKLRQLQYQPSALCDDATFIRRLSLDLRGLLPTAAEAKAFLDDKGADKRRRWIDQFLDSPEFARSWGLKMADLLRINSKVLSPAEATAYSQWVYESVKSNMPYDRFVTELLTASGTTAEVQPANFFRVTSDTKMVTETVAQVFLGARIMCAQCHNHPYESWTQDNYYQMASAFHEVDRVIAAGSKHKQLPAPGSTVTIGRTPGRAISNPRTGIEQPPWPTEVVRTDDEDRRIAFASWLTSPDNADFARVAVNRIWSYLLGRGLVEPVDDFRSSNPAVNIELLDALAKEFVESGFDRKQIVRVILNSRTYQRSSNTNQFNETDHELFSHARVRLLSAEQMQDAVTRFCQGDGETEADAVEYMTQQPFPHLTPFLKAFGQPERMTACACERREEANLDQALQLMNSKLIRDQVTQAGQRLLPLADEELANELYLSAFSRLPLPAEKAAIDRHLASTTNRSQAIEDIVWALINTNEFMFQH